VIPTLEVTGKRLRSCLAAIASTTLEPHEVIVIGNGASPQGYTAPVNAGVRAAAGRYIVIMNDDVETLPGWWPPLRAELDAGATAAFPMTIEGAMRRDFAAWCFAITQNGIEQFSVSPSQFLDERFVVWYQDTDLLVRLRAAGCPPVLVQQSQIRHGLSQTVNSTAPELARWIRAQVALDQTAFQRKHPGLSVAPVS
jgi:GT2 family glycosyltransferase